MYLRDEYFLAADKGFLMTVIATKIYESLDYASLTEAESRNKQLSCCLKSNYLIQPVSIKRLAASGTFVKHTAIVEAGKLVTSQKGFPF